MDKKIIIKSTIEVITGLHIGGNNAYSAIGMVDSPVIKDKLTNKPIIPGSSIKGKMRSLLSLSKNGRVDFDSDGEEILRLFGSSKKGNVKSSRLKFSDATFIEKELYDGISPYEIKAENTINRATLVAMPRQIERVVRGICFNFTIVYDVLNEKELEQDITNLIQAYKLLQLDCLGGGGSRGNGRILFKDFDVSKINDKLELKKDETLTKRMEEVTSYGEMCYKV